MTVSVVVSSYNRKTWLTQTVASILAQQRVDLELIVVDNGSEDSTSAFLASIEDPRLRVIRHEPNIGMIAGQNSGLAAAQGDWLAMVDDDDVWSPDKLQLQLAEMEATGRQWATCGCVFVDENLRILGGNRPPPGDELHRELPRRYIIHGGTSTLVWRRGLLRFDGVSGEVPHLSDWELCLRLAEFGPPAVVSRPLVAYRQHGSAMSMRTEEYLEELERLHHLHPSVNPPVSRPHMHLFLGSQHLRSGDPAVARHHFWEALRGGNTVAIPRLGALLVPRAGRALVRRHLHSDRSYLNEAERWLGDFRRGHALVDDGALRSES